MRKMVGWRRRDAAPYRSERNVMSAEFPMQYQVADRAGCVFASVGSPEESALIAAMANSDVVVVEDCLWVVWYRICGHKISGKVSEFTVEESGRAPRPITATLPEQTELPDDVQEAIYSKLWDLYEDCKES